VDLQQLWFSNFGDQSFEAAGPRLWNSHPIGLGQKDIGYEQLKQLLDIHVFV